MPNSLIEIKENTPVLAEEIEWALIRYKHMADDAQESYKDLMAKLKAEMEKRGIVRIETDRVILTISNPADREVFDAKRFREDHPDLYDEYVTMKEQKPVLKPSFRELGAYDYTEE